MTGAAGSGKSLVAAALAARLRARFVDGDDLHTRAHRAKIMSGAALDDDDRRLWLDAMSLVLADQAPVVVASTPLRRAYRDRLRAAAGDVWFAELVMPADAAAVKARRRRSRRDRVVPEDLVDPRLGGPEERDRLPLATDEAGGRFAHDADLGSIVDRIASVREAQSLR